MRGQRLADPSKLTAAAALALTAVASDSAAMVVLAAMALDSCWYCRPYGPPTQRAYNLEAT
jgi:hypothetical protein